MHICVHFLYLSYKMMTTIIFLHIFYLYMYYALKSFDVQLVFIQMESDCEAIGRIHTIDKIQSFVCGWVCVCVGKLFRVISGTNARSSKNEVPISSSSARAMLGHN